MIQKIKEFFNRNNVLRKENEKIRKERDEWRAKAIYEAEQGDYWVRIAGYYRSQWEETLTHVSPEIRNQFIVSEEMRH